VPLSSVRPNRSSSGFIRLFFAGALVGRSTGRRFLTAPFNTVFVRIMLLAQKEVCTEPHRKCCLCPAQTSAHCRARDVRRQRGAGEFLPKAAQFELNVFAVAPTVRVMGHNILSSRAPVGRCTVIRLAECVDYVGVACSFPAYCEYGRSPDGAFTLYHPLAHSHQEER
jgi:hypothetical protein